MKLRFAAALCAAAASVGPAAASSPLDLAFASAPPAALWTPYAQGSGPTFAFANGRLELTFPATSSGGTFGAGIASSCKLSGDFDVDLEYVLLDWPISNGVRTGVVLGGSWATGAVERTSFGTSDDFPGLPREVYLTHMADGVNGIVETTDFAGRLRFVRTGTTLTGSYASADGWTGIHTGFVEGGDLSVSLQAWSHDYAFTDRDVRVAFTRFEVRSGRVVCGDRILVTADVKPGSAANPIKASSQGTTPVAILGSAHLDAAQIDPATVRVAGAPVAANGETLQASLEDVNGDGRPDLVVHVPTPAMALPEGTTSIAVVGSTAAGLAFVAYDAVTVIR